MQHLILALSPTGVPGTVLTNTVVVGVWPSSTSSSPPS